MMDGPLNMNFPCLPALKEMDYQPQKETRMDSYLVNRLKPLKLNTEKRSQRFCAMISVAAIATINLFYSPAFAAEIGKSSGTAKATPVISETERSKVVEKCIFLRNEVAASMTALDWPNLDRLSKEYLKTCRVVLDQKDLAIAHENIAIASIELGNYKQSILDTAACIRIHYANPGCHLLKSEALLLSGMKKEGYEELDIAERLAEHALANAKYERERASSGVDRENQDSYINLLESQLRRISRLRELSF